MFARLWRSTVVVGLVAGFTAAGLVVSSTPAAALGSPASPAIPWKALTGPITASNVQIAGAWASEAALAGGLEAAEGRAAVRGCKTPWSCGVSLALPLVVYGAAESSDLWWPWMESKLPKGEPVDGVAKMGAGFFAPQWYTSDSPYVCQHIEVQNPDQWDAGGPGAFGVKVDVTQTRDGPCYSNWQIAADCVGPNGEWRHNVAGDAATGYGGGLGVTKTISISPCGGDPYWGTKGWELRRIHFTQKQADWPNPPYWAQWHGFDRGFYAGQEVIPQGAVIEQITHCRKPNGDTYDVSTTSQWQAADGVYAVNVGQCDPGDEVVGVETIREDPDGTRHPQLSTDRDAAADLGAQKYPLCADGTCLLQVKVDGDPCDVGEAGCLDWTRRLDHATCWYGPYQMPISMCFILERAYETAPEGVPATRENTDGDPNTQNDWDPQHQYPKEPVPGSKPKPGTQTTPSPSPSTGGGTGPSSSPSPSSSSNPSPSPSPSTSTNPSPSPSPSSSTPTDTGNPDPPSVACASTYALGPVQSEAVKVANDLGPRFGVDTIYGYRDPAADNYGEHSTGLALDFMVYSDHTKGQALADYAVAHAGALGVHWVIWDQHVYNVEKAGTGWRLMEDRGDDTQNHRDHVHVFLYDLDASGLSCAGDPIGDGAGGVGTCWPNGWSWNPTDWVVRPVRCVLVELFVPKGDFMENWLSEVRAGFLNSAVGSWFKFLDDVGTAFDTLSGGGTSFAALTADNGPVDPTVYDGATVAPTLSPAIVDPGGGSVPAGDYSYTGAPWAAPGGALCRGPAVPTGFIGDRGILPVEIYPFSACSGVMEKAATTSRIVITAFLAYSLFWTTFRQMSAAFGFTIVNPEADPADFDRSTIPSPAERPKSF